MFLSEVVEDGANCQRSDCVIVEGGLHQTLAYFPPMKNRSGESTNKDMNTYTACRRCLTCGRTWDETYQK